MKNKESGSKGGIGFIGLLAIAFIVLKLIGVIKWSWVWVLCPIWISVSLLILYIMVVVTMIHKGRW